MKELSIEEKAKRYDGNYEAYTELINRLESVKSAIKEHNYGIAMDILYKPYPEFQITTSTELKESEDERIRKALIHLVKANKELHFGIDNYDGVKWCDILSWLEKQGEQNPADKSKIKPKFKTGDRVIGVISGMPYFITKFCGDHYDTESGCIIMFYSQDNFDLYEQKPEWSEKDGRMLQNILDCLRNGYTKLPSDILQIESWLKSLKDRVQPQYKQGWSQNDIDMIDWLIRCCEKEHEELCNDKYGHQDIVSDLKRDCRKKWNWLESLKNKVVPQNTWKPSEEQILAINTAINVIGKGALNGKELIGLLEQLKAL